MLAGRRIAINAHLLARESSYRRAGVSRYIDNLLANLPFVGQAADYTIYCNRRSSLALPYRQRGSPWPTDRPWLRIPWEQCAQPIEVLSQGIELLHSPVNVQPLVLPCRSVITVMDLTYLVYPQGFRRGQRLYQTLFTRRSIHRADHLIAISASTAADIVRYFGTPRAPISVIYPGVDARYAPIDDGDVLAAFRSARQLPERFFLFIGTLEPRKNLQMLVRAYAEFKAQSGSRTRLVLGGGKGWLYEPIFALVEQLGLKDDVLFPGFIPEDELPLWYNAAVAVVYPSLYEGFGLPVLEAMACGVPVAASNASSLPEILGQAGLLVDPRSIQDWAAALITLDGSEDQRRQLGRQGAERAQRFSWREMTRETVQVYQKVLSGGSSVA